MKLVRITLSILALLVVIVVLGVGAIMFFADPNQLKPVITEAVKKQTGYDLAMNGNLSWSFYPRFGVKMQTMTLSAPGSTTPFVALNNVSMAVDVGAFLKGQHQLNGNLYIAELQLMKAHLSAVNAGLHFNQGILTIDPFTAQLYHGELTGVIHGTNLSTVPSWDWDVTVNQVNMKNLLADVNGADARLTIDGNGNLHFKGNTSGKSGEALFNNINGTGAYSLSNGSVKAIDINYLIQTADALLNKQTIAVPTKVDETTFDRLSGTFTVKNNIFTTNDLDLMASAFTTKGDANIQLVNKDISMHLNVASAKSVKTQWDVPVLVTGNVAKPDVRLDMAAINRAIAQKQIDAVKTKLQQKVKAISNKASDFFKKMMGS